MLYLGEIAIQGERKYEVGRVLTGDIFPEKVLGAMSWDTRKEAEIHTMSCATIRSIREAPRLRLVTLRA